MRRFVPRPPLRRLSPSGNTGKPRLERLVEMMSVIPVGLQMYTVRNEAEKDYIGTLREVARVGYSGVEVGAFPPVPEKELRRVLTDINMKVAAVHVGIQILEQELGRAIDFALEMGCNYLVCPYLPAERRPDASGYIGTAKSLERVGATCREHNLQLLYHNHSFEFEKFNGEYGLDILFKHSDPALLQAELDVYWVKHGGEDPTEYIKKYSGRTPVLHLKDMAGDEARSFTEIGTGIIDFNAIFKAARAAGVRWYVVEQDNWKIPPLESVRISYDNLLRMLGRSSRL